MKPSCIQVVVNLVPTCGRNKKENVAGTSPQRWQIEPSDESFLQNLTFVEYTVCIYSIKTIINLSSLLTMLPISTSAPSSQLPPIALAMPDVWRASELSRARVTTQSSGFTKLDQELPGGGWPRSTLIEVLLQQSGVGEIQLLRPILTLLSARQKIAFVQPPYLPNSNACKFMGIHSPNVLWIKAASSADALWSTEQILKNGSCMGVVLWQTNIRTESLRRLNLAAQSTDTWLWLMRPLSQANDASPAPLRLALRPACGAVSVEIVKRRGPHHEVPLLLDLADMPSRNKLLEDEHAILAQRASAVAAPRVRSAALV